MNELASPYNKLAEDYDCLIGSRQLEGKILDRFLKQYCRKGARVLEIACGTGELLLPLRSRYQVEGLDISKHMIACAKKKMKTIPLHVADMRSFKLARRFEFICCLFDSINHLPKLSDWKRCLTAAHTHLLPSGVFVFDINTPHKLEGLIATPPLGIWLNKQKAAMLKVTAQGSRRFNWEIDIFTRSMASRKFTHNEVVIKEYVPEVSEVARLAREIFRSVKIVDISSRKVTKSSERLYFVCKK